MASEFNHGWRPAKVAGNRPVADGSMWITLEAADGLPASYEPGHVLGLGISQHSGILRHAYTVSRGKPQARQFEHLYRIISEGRMSPHLARLEIGDTVLFHGPFHTPIQQEIQPDAERIVLIATGTGIGPLFGYAEKTLNEGETRPITMVVGFHAESDMCLAAELQALASQYRQFAWHFTVTHPTRLWTGLTGRVTDCMPQDIGDYPLEAYHFHLVGNGAMVHLIKSALHRAGVSPGRVSIETYFNHRAEPANAEIELLAGEFRRIRKN